MVGPGLPLAHVRRHAHQPVPFSDAKNDSWVLRGTVVPSMVKLLIWQLVSNDVPPPN